MKNYKNLQKIHKNFYGKVKATCARYFNDTELEGIVQDCFMSIFKNLNDNIEYVVKKQTINTIILRIQKNNTIYKLSNQYSDFKNFESEEVDFCEELSAEMCLFEIQKLNDLERFVFNFVVIEEFSIEETSKILKIDKETCKKALHASKQNLKRSLFELIQI